MTPFASSSDDIAAQERTSSMLATLGVSSEQFSRHQEQLRQAFLSPQDSRVFPASQSYPSSSLPFPLNLPPSYPVYASASPSTPSTRASRRQPLRQSASLAARYHPVKSGIGAEEFTQAGKPISASSSKGKGKGTLDTFMDSRQGVSVEEPESSGSDSDTPGRKMLGLSSSDDFAYSDSSALPSSSPPSSSPLRTPRETSPLRPMHPYSSSSILKVRAQDTSKVPYVLPSGPYSLEKPSRSLAALIGQALNASITGALALSDIYSYISTVYPYYQPGEQSWMSSIRHSLSMNDAFERVPDREGSKTKRGKPKAKVKGGFWRIKLGDEACFADGNFVKRGARGAGPGKNQTKGRKRLREDDEERDDKKSKGASHRPLLSSSSSTHPQSQPAPLRPPSPARTIYSHLTPRHRLFSPPSLTMSQSTAPSDELLSDPFDLPPTSPTTVDNESADTVTGSPGSPDLPLALIAARRNAAAKNRALSSVSSLKPGFEFSDPSDIQSPLDFLPLKAGCSDVDRELFARVLASTSSTDAPKPTRLLFPPALPSPLPSSSPLPGFSSSPTRPTTPTPRPSGAGPLLSLARMPMSHRGLHMSPSRSLSHYQSSLDPEWKTGGSSSGTKRCNTPPPRDRSAAGEEAAISTPKKLVFSSTPPQVSPFRTPARSTIKQQPQRGYDPYDPNTLLADELASIRNAYEPQESPGGFFGKEGRKLLYDSPGVPSRSHWRFRDEF